ncbi:DUF3080 family protein [Flocculibacter collagenilyticus]|uniref:DUF3080 family protein n=1 Tax=Flocculibacter collagenilyticus TaxID=2744479 RepID=UPI0018F3898D|nr:DUF3080 family protein [Flocculibacter collagenilyticus]
MIYTKHVYQNKKNKVLILLCAFLPLAGCTPTPLSIFDTYEARLEKTLTKALSANSNSNNLPSLESVSVNRPTAPRFKLLERPIPEMSMGLVNTFKYARCGLQELIGQRNSGLGRLMPPSHKLRYEITFIDIAEICLAEEKLQNDEELKTILVEKRQALPIVFNNFIINDKELRHLISVGKNALEEEGNAGLTQAIEVLNYLLDIRAQIEQSSMPAVTQLEPLLSELYGNNSVPNLLKAELLLLPKLQSLNQYLSTISHNRICANKASLKHAEVLFNINQKYFIEGLQGYLAKLQRYHFNIDNLIISLFMPVNKAQSTSQHAEFEKYLKYYFTSEPDSLQSQLKNEIQAHVKWWVNLRKTCNNYT